jgi:hypothetical protein
MALLLKGNILDYMGEKSAAEVAFIDAELYAKNRNEHLLALAFLYDSQKRWDDMMRIINVAMLPERKNPFPKDCFLIEDRAYYDTGNLWVELKEKTMRRLTEPVISNDSLDFDFE